MTAKTDDLEAVRLLADTLQPFTGEERERIIRWARERLGMVATAGAGGSAPAEVSHVETPGKSAAIQASANAADIKNFVTQKAPKSDVHFAATVAYYHQFVAPTGQRKAGFVSQRRTLGRSCVTTGTTSIPRRSCRTVSRSSLRTLRCS